MLPSVIDVASQQASLDTSTARAPQPSSFGILLRRHRRAAGLTQEALAARSRLSVRAISDLERGVNRTAQWASVRHLADALQLTGDERLIFESASVRRDGPHGLHRDAASPINLPREHTPLLGRKRETVSVADLLRDPHARLVTLTGAAGSGKTRLAVHIGRTVHADFEAGVSFVSLAPLRDPALILSAIAETLGVKDEGRVSLDETLFDRIGARHLLLILDNFEHILDAHRMVTRLLDACPRLCILVTSRIPLHVQDEHEYPVAPLAIPDLSHLPGDLDHLLHYEAVALFVQRAQAVDPAFRLTNENARAVAGICSRLEGLPLAIELAAARSKFFPPRTLLERLSKSLALLTGGPRDLPERQRTLRGAIDWSYSLLNEQERALFARLSLFTGGCDLGAAEAVCNSEGELDAVEGLTSLVNQSLVWREGEDELRFRMLETIREYAQEKLAERGEEEPVAEAHTLYFLALAEDAGAHLAGPDRAAQTRRLRADMANIVAALTWLMERGRFAEGLRLATAVLDVSWSERGLVRRHLEEGLARGDDAPLEVRAAAFLKLSEILERSGDLEQADARARESLALYRAAGDPGRVAHVEGWLGLLATLRGDYAEARAWCADAVRRSLELADPWGSSRTLGRLGHVDLYQGDVESARNHYEQSLTFARESGDPLLISPALVHLSTIDIDEGKLDRARARLEEAKSLAESVLGARLPAAVLDGLGFVDLEQDKYDSARARFETNLSLTVPLEENRLTVAGALADMAQLAARMGQARRAALLGGAAEALRESILGVAILPPLSESVRYVQGYVHWLDNARQAMKEEEWGLAWQQGRALDLYQAVELALSDRER